MELAAFSWLAGYGDLTSMGLGDLARYREAKPRALPSSPSLVSLVEALKDAPHLFLGYADTCVRDRDHHPLSIAER